MPLLTDYSPFKFFYKNAGSPPKAEYSYFSADSKLKYPPGEYSYITITIAKFDTLFMTKTAENRTLWGRTYLYSL